MSWAEEQSWFGLEDLVLDAIYEAEEDLRNGIWVAKDGTKYSISKMTTSHIKNCIRMIQRSNYRWRPEYLELLVQELKRRYKWTPRKYRVYDTTGAWIGAFDSWKSAYSFCLTMGRRDWQIK